MVRRATRSWEVSATRPVTEAMRLCLTIHPTATLPPIQAHSSATVTGLCSKAINSATCDANCTPVPMEARRSAAYAIHLPSNAATVLTQPTTGHFAQRQFAAVLASRSPMARRATASCPTHGSQHHSQPAIQIIAYLEAGVLSRRPLEDFNAPAQAPHCR